MLLSHLHHGQLLNIPYFLLESLKSMTGSVRHSKHPQTCITNHGLIKLLVIHALRKRNATWHELIGHTETQGLEVERREDTEKVTRRRN
jgi:hypothetical protein